MSTRVPPRHGALLWLVLASSPCLAHCAAERGTEGSPAVVVGSDGVDGVDGVDDTRASAGDGAPPGASAAGSMAQPVAAGDDGEPVGADGDGAPPASPGDGAAGEAASVALPDAGAGGDPLDAAGPGAALAARPIAAPPSYTGNARGGSGCGDTYATLGHEPQEAAGVGLPLFLYFVGTTFSDSDQSARHDSEAAMAVTEAMARRGFVALSVQYDNTLSLDPNKLECMYGEGNPESLLAIACALPRVECDAGIATWGHSQGALMAHAASAYDARVRAVWTTGYSGGSYPLPDTRLRVVNGAGDFMNGSVAVLNRASGMSEADCPDDGRSECLRADGSGWIQVRAQDCQISSGDHCWFDKRSCIDSQVMLEPNWVDPASSAAFALETNADWVARTVRR